MFKPKKKVVEKIEEPSEEYFEEKEEEEVGKNVENCQKNITACAG
jgi:hypothetical protein